MAEKKVANEIYEYDQKIREEQGKKRQSLEEYQNSVNKSIQKVINRIGR